MIAMNTKLLALGAVALTLATAVVVWRLDVAGAGPMPNDLGVTYRAVPFTEMARTADVVVAGEVVAISPTRWNQDSGQYWEETRVDAAGRSTSETALPYYEVTVRAARPIVSDARRPLAAGGTLVLTVIGASPLDARHPARGPMPAETNALGVGVGDTAVFFADATSLAWRSGSRAVLVPVGDPARSTIAYTGGGRLTGTRDAAVAATSLDGLAARVLALRSAGATE
jgi:hypothetical protein